MPSAACPTHGLCRACGTAEAGAEAGAKALWAADFNPGVVSLAGEMLGALARQRGRRRGAFSKDVRTV